MREKVKLPSFAGTGGYCLRSHECFTRHAFDEPSFQCESYLPRASELFSSVPR
jgi:hypothetical protein